MSRTAQLRRKRESEPDVPEAAKKQKETTLEFIASMAVVLVTGLFIITFNLQAFEIPSSSMENTLLIGDHVFVDRVRHAPSTSWLGPIEPYRDVRRGDIIVFLSVTQPGMYIVKRIIGVPGDRIHLLDGAVYRNGEKLDEPYARHCARDNSCAEPTAQYHPYRDNFPAVPPGDMSGATAEWRLTLGSHLQNGDVVVPPDSYFAMGDNRDVSFDSRFWGFIPKENLIGRPLFIYWSFETPRGQYEKNSIGERVAFMGKVVIHFLDETRWSRMLHRVF